MKLIECVPNFSEGRDESVITAIAERISGVAGATVLHITADASHNRSVITFVAPAEAMVNAAFAAIRAARDHIDLRTHAGVHPRIGAADVVPFIPLEGATMDDCVAIARELGRRVGEELEIPVYLYERAATRDSRRPLPEVRRGGLDGVAARIANPDDAPDFGPARLHPSAGAVAIGARPFLVAYNVYIGDASQLPVARDVARAVRESSGGLPAVRALGLEVDGQAQLSMNLIDIDRTPLSVVFDRVEAELRARGGAVEWSEIIGLVPERVAFDVAGSRLRLRDSLADHVLERQLLARRAPAGTLHGYIDAIGSGDPFPGGGSAAAIAGALAAALARMVAGLTLGRERYADVADEMQELHEHARAAATALESFAARDAEAYAAVTDARRLPVTTDAERAQQRDALMAALLEAARVPLDVARMAAAVTAMALRLAERGNRNALTDAGTAALLAEAACRAAAYNVRINLRTLAGMQGQPAAPEAARLAAEVASLVARAEESARQVAALVEPAL